MEARLNLNSEKAIKQQELRRRAEDTLEHGRAPPTHGWLTSHEALRLLYELASTPGRAGDALKLLHELQVHQVELDLQHEQLEASERELTEDLNQNSRLFEFAPVGYFDVSAQGRINRVNIAGATICREDRAALIGRPIDAFLAAESRPVLKQLLEQVRGRAPAETCEVSTGSGATFHVKAGLMPGGSSILIVFMEITGPRRSVRRA